MRYLFYSLSPRTVYNRDGKQLDKGEEKKENKTRVMKLLYTITSIDTGAGSLSLVGVYIAASAFCWARARRAREAF